MTKQEKVIQDKIAKLKSSLGDCGSLSLDDYDNLYGDIEEIQYLFFELTDEVKL